MDIQKIDKQKASKIIENYSPIGLFYYEENSGFTGIDNSSGDCNVEHFTNLDHAIKWLNDEFEISDYINDPTIADKEINKVDELKKELDKMDYSLLVKALISMDKNVNDPTQLDKMYQQFMKSDANLLNDFFNEIMDLNKVGIDDRLERANCSITHDTDNFEKSLKTNQYLDNERGT